MLQTPRATVQTVSKAGVLGSPHTGPCIGPGLRRATFLCPGQRGFMVWHNIRVGVYDPYWSHRFPNPASARPFLLPLYTRVRGTRILGSWQRQATLKQRQI